MKKILLAVFFFAVAGAFSEAVRLSPDVSEEMLSAAYWIAQTKKADKVRMSLKAIAQANAQAHTISYPSGNWTQTLLCDLRQYPKAMNGSTLVRNMFTAEAKLKWYQKSRGSVTKVSEAYWEDFFEKTGITALNDPYRIFTARKAVCVHRSNIRIIPTDACYSDDKDYWYDDVVQNSGLLMNEPVLAFCETTDKKWIFIQTEFCSGWVHAEDIAFCSDAEFASRFDYASQNQASFVTVTADTAVLASDYVIAPNGEAAFSVELFMGTYLRAADWSAEPFPSFFAGRDAHAAYAVEIPYRKKDGSLGTTYAAVPASLCCAGVLPFTAEQVLSLAFKTLGNRYGWGGMASQRDCSELTMEVFRCFGVQLPRNSTQQASYPAKTLSFAKMSNRRRHNALKDVHAGAILRMPGHVALYLGYVKGKHYVISAMGSYRLTPGGTVYDINSVNVNTVNVLRKNNNKSWLENLTTAKF